MNTFLLYNTITSANTVEHVHCFCRTTTGGVNFCCHCGLAEPWTEHYNAGIEEVYNEPD